MSRVTCGQFILDYLDSYLDASLDEELASELERHLASCSACVAYLRTYSKTRELVGRAAEIEMPREMETLLCRLLADQHGNGRP